MIVSSISNKNIKPSEAIKASDIRESLLSFIQKNHPEFSNEGYACCAYKNNSSNRPPLNKRLNSVDDLRNSSLPLAIQSDSNYYYISDEGRLFHNSNWESKFNHWLKDKVLV